MLSSSFLLCGAVAGIDAGLCWIAMERGTAGIVAAVAVGLAAIGVGLRRAHPAARLAATVVAGALAIGTVILLLIRGLPPLDAVFIFAILGLFPALLLYALLRPEIRDGRLGETPREMLVALLKLGAFGYALMMLAMAFVILFPR